MNTPKMQQVSRILHELKSPFGAQLDKLAGEVNTALHEASENSKFLQTLTPYFQVAPPRATSSR